MITNLPLLNVTIKELIRKDGQIIADCECGKTNAFVWIHEAGIRIICNNAAHKAWKGMGRFFHRESEALSSYKSIEMKSIILKAIQLNS